MRKDTMVALGEHFTSFVETRVQQGRYGSASEVLQAGLRLLEEQEARLDALQSALIEGEQSGPATAFDFEAFLRCKRDKYTPPT